MYTHDSVLRRHVLESNLIEGIVAGPGNALYDGHLVATRMVVQGSSIHPNQLHKTLFRRVPLFHIIAGKYRTIEVNVGAQHMPRHECVPALMEEWSSMVMQYEKATENLEEIAFFLHAWFLCIHPYPDGNGRTARITWNMLRINKSLPWHIEYAKTKQLYYVRVRDIEDDEFKKRHPDVY